MNSLTEIESQKYVMSAIRLVGCLLTHLDSMVVHCTYIHSDSIPFFIIIFSHGGLLQMPNIKNMLYII